MLEPPVVATAHGSSGALFICSIVYQLLDYRRISQSRGVSQIVKFVRSDLLKMRRMIFPERVLGVPARTE